MNAWQCILPDVRVKGFKKSCISNAVDVIDDNMLWKSSEQDRNVRNECEGDEGTDCEGGDSDNGYR